MPSGPGFTVTFLYYFVSTALLGAFISSQALSISLSSRIPFQIGIVLGAIGGGVATYFYRSVTIELPIQGSKLFMNRLNQTLVAMGFASQSELDEGITVYQKSNMGNLLVGSVYVQVGTDSVTLMSRAITIRRLQKQLISN